MRLDAPRLAIPQPLHLARTPRAHLHPARQPTHDAVIAARQHFVLALAAVHVGVILARARLTQVGRVVLHDVAEEQKVEDAPLPHVAQPGRGRQQSSHESFHVHVVRRARQLGTPAQKLGHDGAHELSVHLAHERRGHGRAVLVVELELLVFGHHRSAAKPACELRDHVTLSAVDPDRAQLNGHSQAPIRVHAAAEPLLRLEDEHVCHRIERRRRGQARRAGADDDDGLPL